MGPVMIIRLGSATTGTAGRARGGSDGTRAGRHGMIGVSILALAGAVGTGASAGDIVIRRDHGGVRITDGIMIADWWPGIGGTHSAPLEMLMRASLQPGRWPGTPWRPAACLRRHLGALTIRAPAFSPPASAQVRHLFMAR